jgi:transcriptional regulator with XRE-family HTH domain
MLLIMPAQKRPASPFGERLIALRRARSMTQSQLAAALGVHQSTISYHEAVADLPAGDVVLKLALALGVTTDELLGAAPPPKLDSPAADPEARRYWRRFQRLMLMPEKDRKAVIRMLDTMTKAHAAEG